MLHGLTSEPQTYADPIDDLTMEPNLSSVAVPRGTATLEASQGPSKWNSELAIVEVHVANCSVRVRNMGYS